MKRINWRGYFTRNKKKKKSPLDINELFPGYFNKNVFRAVLLIMILFTVFVFISNNGQLRFNFIACPEDSPLLCKYDNSSDELKPQILYLQPGETIGNLPNYWASHYNRYCLLMVLLGFIINHLFYFMRTKTFRIPINKEKWEKVKEGVNRGFENNK